jgi:dTDP-glucose pyrophosphorylase
VTRAVVLAAGRGTRMRAAGGTADASGGRGGDVAADASGGRGGDVTADASRGRGGDVTAEAGDGADGSTGRSADAGSGRKTDVDLDAAQAAAADRGLKALVPFAGQPFLAYVLTTLADAGFSDVCVVTGPGTTAVRAHFEQLRTQRLRLHFAVQSEPLGSAHALAAAEDFCDGHPFAVINADNLYPVEALRTLRNLNGSGLIGFRRDGLLAGNITADRIAAFATLDVNESGELIGITEKPDAAAVAQLSGDSMVSMTCWRFGPDIFDAIRITPRSERGEFEIPDAVRIALRHERFVVVPMGAPVLDLSRREDIPRVAVYLAGTRVSL